MRVVNMHEAKTHLSRLVQAAAQGEPFIIARAGTPMVKVVAVDAPEPGSGAQDGFPVRRRLVAGRFRPHGVERDRGAVRRRRMRLL